MRWSMRVKCGIPHVRMEESALNPHIPHDVTHLICFLPDVTASCRRGVSGVIIGH